MDSRDFWKALKATACGAQTLLGRTTQTRYKQTPDEHPHHGVKAKEGIAIGCRTNGKIACLKGGSRPLEEDRGAGRDEAFWLCSPDVPGNTARKDHAYPPHRPTAMYEYEWRQANKASRHTAPRMACTCKCNTYFITMRKHFILMRNRQPLRNVLSFAGYSHRGIGRSVWKATIPLRTRIQLRREAP